MNGRTLVGIVVCALLLLAAVLDPSGMKLSPSPPEPLRQTPRAEPIATLVAGERKTFEVDALLAYGATPWEEICPAGAAPPPGDDVWRVLACGTGREPDDAAPVAAAGFRLNEAGRLDGEARERAVRDANAAALRDLKRPNRPKSDDWRGLAAAYSALTEKAGDPRLHDIAAEAALVDAALCDRAKEPSCASEELERLGETLVEVGRRSNSLARLARAAELLRQAVENLPADTDAEDRASLIEELGSAYSYAAHFEPEGRKLKWLELAIEAGERNLPYADAHAPSFTSARIWSNLGSSYNSRGGEQTSSADFRKSIAYYDKALTFFKREDDAVQWAQTTENYAAARSSLASVERDLALHDRAIADFEASAAVFDGQSDESFEAAFVRYRLVGAFIARAETALALKKRGGNDPAPGALDDVMRDSFKRGLAAADAAEPALKAAGSDVYVERLLTDRRTLVRRAALLDGAKPQ